MGSVSTGDLTGLVSQQRALAHRGSFAVMIAALSVAAAGLWGINRYEARSAVLHFEETPPETIMTLGLSGMVMTPRDGNPGSSTV